MRIEEIKISVFELPGNTTRFNLVEEVKSARRRWIPKSHTRSNAHVHVLHVRTDEDVEGICTVGDARYTTMQEDDLEQLRILTLGEDPFNRELLNAKLRAATRGMFTVSGWFGAFDNCLWDIAGKVANQPVYRLTGRARASAPAYYNFGGHTPEAAAEDAQKAIGLGFSAVKDHFHSTAGQNIEWFVTIRQAVGPDVDILHDAAGCRYSFEEALYVGRTLEELDFGWFEEPLADRDQVGLHRLCQALTIPVLAPESMMNDRDLSALWLISGTTDLLRANARHGTTPLLKLAHLAELHGTTVELNGPGGLFGLVHAHLVCAITNTSYYEYFPGGTRDEVGKEIGLLNPPVPRNGHIVPPSAPGWGAEWDWNYFNKNRIAEL